MPQFKSGFEKSIGNFLKASGVKYEYEPFKLYYNLHPKGVWCHKCGDGANVVVEHVYIPDFVFNNGNLVVEAKGKLDSETRTKMLAVIEANPHIEFRLLFMRDNWLTRTKKKRYTDWAKQKGIKCAVASFPEEWVEEVR
jgi:hypothetical protein